MSTYPVSLTLRIVKDPFMITDIHLFFDKARRWKEELLLLREIFAETGLKEELKWGKPCYLLGKSNVALMHSFKDYCGVLFFKGVFLKDEKKLLIRQTERVQAARQMRYTSVEELSEQASILKSYIFEAIEIEKAGLKVELKKTRDFNVAPEFQEKLDASADLKTAFKNLTPGRQRGYLIYFGEAKQSKTRASRVEKYIPAILNGKGIDD